jgi:hypothetical protein
MSHVNNLMKIMRFGKDECVMFDDDHRIVREMNRYGVRTVKVNHKIGVTLNDVRELL